MLKPRIIGVVLVKAGIAVQSIKFQRYLPIGKPEIAINYLDRWGVDEIVVLDIDATRYNIPINGDQVKSYARQCQVPLSIGGGITQLSDIQRIIRAGADKIVVNSSLLSNPTVITQGAELFGKQSIIVSIDAQLNSDGTYSSWNHPKKISTHLSVKELAKRAESLGAGEILLNSVDRDGTKQGFDLTLLQTVNKNLNIPMIACGGAGHPKHIVTALSEGGVSAVAVANLLHFTEHSVIVIKQYLKSALKPVRLDSYVTYQDFNFDPDGRIAKQEDEVLEDKRFQIFIEERI